MSLRVILGGIGLLCMASLLGGCVGQGEYDRLFETNRSLTARNAELTRERDEARAHGGLAEQGRRLPAGRPDGGGAGELGHHHQQGPR